MDVLNVGGHVDEFRNGTEMGVGFSQYGLRRTIFAICYSTFDCHMVVGTRLRGTARSS